MLNRAYSLLTVKAIDEDQRVITGIATTPSPDRVGDIVEPEGAEFKLPLPLLWQHDRLKPIGYVTEAKVTSDGIQIRAQIEREDEPGTLKDRLDEAWQSIKKGLVRGLSVGFKEIEAARIEQTYSYRYLRWLWLELSAVTIPANGEATVQTVKSIDTELRAASGQAQDGDRGDGNPGVSGAKTGRAQTRVVSIKPRNERKTAMDIAAQIAAFEAKRAANEARLLEIQSKAAAEGRTKDASEQEEFTNLKAEIEAIDKELADLRQLQSMKAATAKPATGSTAEGASDARDVRPFPTVKTAPKVEPGIRFARVVKCLGLARGNRLEAAQIAEANYKDDPAVVNILKAAVAAGTTSNTTWAGNLVGAESSVFADFVEFLRPQTILGKFGTGNIPSLRRVPFRVALVGQSSGGAGYWVGEGKAKPVTKFDFSRTTLEPLKVANIAVLTEETIRDSSPSAEILVRDQLATALRERMDTDFVDPTKAASAGVSPASITNGVTAIASSGATADNVRTDLKKAFKAFIDANNAPTTGVWIMSATTALALSLMVNALGQPEFPGINMNGGTLSGLPVIVSEYVPTDSSGSLVILVNASDVYLGDNGDIAVDMSREASLQMDGAPTGDSGTPTAAQLVSLWQTNSVGFRAERTINWSKRRSSAVAYLNNVNWG